MPSKAFRNAKMASNGIVQIAKATSTAATAFAANTDTASGVSVSIVTKTNNPSYLITAWSRATDTTSVASGMGIGLQYSLNGTTWTYLEQGGRNDFYDSGATDKYVKSHITFLATDIPAPLGSTVYFRSTIHAGAGGYTLNASSGGSNTLGIQVAEIGSGE